MFEDEPPRPPSHVQDCPSLPCSSGAEVGRRRSRPDDDRHSGTINRVSGVGLVEALARHKVAEAAEKVRLGPLREEPGLVFTTSGGSVARWAVASPWTRGTSCGSSRRVRELRG